MAEQRELSSVIVLGGFRSILHSCAQCGSPVPVNGLVHALSCPSCDAPVQVPASLWEQTFRALTMTHVLSHHPGADPGGAVECKDPSGLGTLRSEFWLLAAPLCSHCSSPIAVQDASFGQPGFAMSCPKCGKSVSFAPPSVSLPRSSLLLTHVAANESELSSAGPSAPLASAATAPVIFQCPNCSASLPIDPTSKRTVTCRYCEASVYLPDGLWRQLHPIKTAQIWTGVFRVQPDVLRSEAQAGCLGMMLGLTVIGLIPGVFVLVAVLNGLKGATHQTEAAVFLALGCVGLVACLVVLLFILNGLRRELGFAARIEQLAART